MVMVTVDDPTRLSAAEKAVQALSGRASIYAMLSILTILIVDAKILGSLQGQAAGSGKVQFALLLGVVASQGLLRVEDLQPGLRGGRGRRAAGEKNYLGNARGAKVATLICAAVTLCVLAFGFRMAF